MGCGALRSLVIPDNVTSIGDWALACTGMESLAIPKSVTKVGEGAFESCDQLKTLYAPASLSLAKAEVPKTTQIIRR